MALQGYDEIQNPDTGEMFAVERSTGEVYETIALTVPVGTIFYTPEQQRAYEERRQRESEALLREKERRRRRNSTPKFYFVSAEWQKYKLRPATMARLVYLATFLDYYGRLKTNIQRDMKFSDLENILLIKKTEVFHFWNEVKNSYVLTYKNGHLYMPSNFSCRGKLPNGIHYQQFYIESVQRLYRETIPTRHRYLGYVFNLLPYINIEYNILCHNPLEQELDCVEPLSMISFAMPSDITPQIEQD